MTRGRALSILALGSLMMIAAGVALQASALPGYAVPLVVGIIGWVVFALAIATDMWSFKRLPVVVSEEDTKFDKPPAANPLDEL